MIRKKTTKRGRPQVYEPDKKLQAFFYGLAEVKRTIRGINRCLKTVAQLFLDLDQAISYATLNRFWHQLSSVAEKVFKDLVQVMNNLGLEDILVKGWYAVKTHVYLILLLRLAITIARYQHDNESNLRKISIGEGIMNQAQSIS